MSFHKIILVTLLIASILLNLQLGLLHSLTCTFMLTVRIG